MNKKQNSTRSRKKLSRIILPNDDSSEEENTSKDREHSGAGSHATDEHTRQHWASGPSRSSVQPKVLLDPAGNQSSGQRLQVLPDKMDAIPGALNVKFQSHNQVRSASSHPGILELGVLEDSNLKIKCTSWNVCMCWG